MDQLLYVLLFTTIALVQVVVRALRQRQEAAAHAQFESLPEPGSTASQVVAMPPPPLKAREPGVRAASAATRQLAGRTGAPPPAPPRAQGLAAIRVILRSPEGLARSLVLSTILGKPRSLEPIDADDRR